MYKEIQEHKRENWDKFARLRMRGDAYENVSSWVYLSMIYRPYHIVNDISIDSAVLQWMQQYAQFDSLPTSINKKYYKCL